MDEGSRGSLSEWYRFSLTVATAALFLTRTTVEVFSCSVWVLEWRLRTLDTTSPAPGTTTLYTFHYAGILSCRLLNFFIVVHWLILDCTADSGLRWVRRRSRGTRFSELTHYRHNQASSGASSFIAGGGFGRARLFPPSRLRDR